MRFCLINQFYPPDLAPTGVKLEAVANALAQRGHEVSVICSRQWYAGAVKEPPAYLAPDNVTVVRLAASGVARNSLGQRVREYSRFAGRCFWKVLTASPRPDVVIVMSSPPYIGTVVSAACMFRRIPVAHWIMDAYPEALFAAGLVRRDGLPGRLLKFLMRSTLKRSRLAVTVGREVAEVLAGLGGAVAVDLVERVGGSSAVGVVYWSSLWADGHVQAEPTAAAVQEVRRNRRWRDGEVVFLYSGNLGRGHIIEDFLRAALLPAGPLPVKWIFAGEGMRAGEVARFQADHPAAPIEILPYCSPDELPLHLRAADVHMASLDPKWERVMLPSKLQNILAAGRPVLFVGNPDGTMGRWVRESGAGWCIMPGDVEGMRFAVNEAMDHEKRRGMGASAARFARANWECGTLVGQLVDAFESVAGDK